MKKVKLFLVLGVITLSIIFVGCASSDKRRVNATYIKTHFEENDVDGDFDLVDNYSDFIKLLKDDAPKKYDEEFFKTNSLLVFKNIESSSASLSEIKSYTIENHNITVVVETVKVGDDCAMGYWWFILELDKVKEEDINKVKIIKNDEELVMTISK